MQYLSLYAFQLTYFVMIGAYTFASKYYAEIGLTESQIGCMVAIPTVIAMVFTPMFGMLADRVPKKRWVLTGILLVVAVIYFWMNRFTYFAVLLVLAVAASAFSNSITPNFLAISLEYTRQIGRPYGPVRLFGTIGYQLGALLIGRILFSSLRGLYAVMACILLCAAALTLIMPDVRGHQNASEKMALRELFRDKHISWLYLLLFFAGITTQFYAAFLSKHLGDIGFDNSRISFITAASVAIEIPFLMFADRIYRKTSIWNWIMIGYFCNALRWIGLSFARSLPLILLFQLPGITALACVEFFPALYLAERASAKLANSAQSVHHVVVFGAGALCGSAAGGFISERIGISRMFLINGLMLVVLGTALLPVTRRLLREDRVTPDR